MLIRNPKYSEEEIKAFMRKTKKNPYVKYLNMCHSKQKEELERKQHLQKQPTTRRNVAHNMFVFLITDFKTYTYIKVDFPKIRISDFLWI